MAVKDNPARAEAGRWHTSRWQNSMRMRCACRLTIFSFGPRHAQQGAGKAELPESLIWLWRDYDFSSKIQPGFPCRARMRRIEPLWRVAAMNRTLIISGLSRANVGRTLSSVNPAISASTRQATKRFDRRLDMSVTALSINPASQTTIHRRLGSPLDAYWRPAEPSSKPLVKIGLPRTWFRSAACSEPAGIARSSRSLSVPTLQVSVFHEFPRLHWIGSQARVAWRLCAYPVRAKMFRNV